MLFCVVCTFLISGWAVVLQFGLFSEACSCVLLNFHLVFSRSNVFLCFLLFCINNSSLCFCKSSRDSLVILAVGRKYNIFFVAFCTFYLLVGLLLCSLGYLLKPVPVYFSIFTLPCVCDTLFFLRSTGGV